MDAINKAEDLTDRVFRIFYAKGDLVESTPLTSKASWEGERVVYHRQNLHACLMGAATSGKRSGEPAILQLSSRVLNCDSTHGMVTLENGETLHANLIVGADEIHSAVWESF